jgi:hypothetical protein
MAYHSAADILGYGGAAGGGKSDLLIGLACTKHLRSLVLRREAVQLRALIDRSREVFANTGAKFNENTGVWRGLPGGRQLEFGGVANPGDEQKYRGRPHDLLAFDEADQFTEAVVRFLTAWLRTTRANQSCRVVICFNPPASAEGRWLLSYFGPWIDPKHPRPAAPGELRWYATLPDGKEEERHDGTPFLHGRETIKPRSRTFVPARVADNPYLMATDYVATLQALPEPLRSQLLYGDMAAGSEDDPWQVIPTAWVRLAQERWTPDVPEGFAMSAIGVDVARAGKDKTVIAPRYGPWFAPMSKFPGSATPDGPTVAARVHAVHDGRAVVNIDMTGGWGGSPYDCLAPSLGELLVGVNNSARAEGTDRSGKLGFVNVRAASYWRLREALDPDHGEGLMLPPDAELMADLCAPRYSVQARGIAVEPKEDIIKRIGRSPDVGDACVLALWHQRKRELWIL